MSNLIWTRKELETIFWRWTIDALGVEEEQVRKSWLTEGAPMWKNQEDVIFLRVSDMDDPYNRQTDVRYTPNGEFLKRSQEYTRVHEVYWVVYGPNSYDNAEKIRYTLFGDGDFLRKNRLFLVTDVPAPRRVPEPHDGQWWERSDLTAHFNEFVRIESATPPIIGVEIRTITEKGEI
jgi:hypothetical protein